MIPLASSAARSETLPVVIEARRRGDSLIEAGPWLRDEIASHLPVVGGMLLRGFDVAGVDGFRSFATAFGHPLLTYEFASTPRSTVSSGIYTSTEYPAHQHIPLHNEQAYTCDWPMKIWFYCVMPAKSGGETPIADSRRIYESMPDTIRKRFAEGLLYVRNYGDFDVPWQQVFNTGHRQEVEAFCAAAGIAWEWKPDGGLRTTQLCQGVERHPTTGEMVWFNQAHLFHISNLQAEVRETLIDIVGLEEMPRNVFFADGSPIEFDMLDTVRAVIADHTVVFPWLVGDVLMLDNMLVAHGRTPFQGQRKVVVAMAEPQGKSR
jgi:alpha-ketoglutarate-dependent taurine dioxygenase